MRFIGPMLLATTLLAAPAAAQDKPKHLLRFVDKDKQSVIVEQQMHMAFRSEEDDSSQAKQETRRYRQVTLAVTDGSATKVERTYNVHQLLLRYGRKQERLTHVLEGDKVILVFAKGRVTSPTKSIMVPAEPKKGAGSGSGSGKGSGSGSGPVKLPDVKRALVPSDVSDEFVDNPWTGLMPVEAVAVGGKWKVDPKVVRRALGIASGDFKGGKGSGTLSEIVTYRGRRCAKVTLKMSGIISDPRHELRMDLALDGTVYVDLERRQPLELQVEGKVLMEREETDHKGTISFREVRRFDD